MHNAIVFMSDEHNPFISSVYGHPFVQTPNMQHMANLGTVFQNAYCPSPLCLPSRTAFMTGQRVHTLQTYNNANIGLDDTPRTFADAMKEQSIHTVYIGKTDVHKPAEHLGFSEIIYPKDRQQPGDTNISRNPLQIREGAGARGSEFGEKEDAFKQDVMMVDAAIHWLNTQSSLIKKPWVLVFNLLNPHFPQWNTKALWELYKDYEDLPEFDQTEPSGQHQNAKELRAHFQTEQFEEKQIKGLRRGYYGNVTFIDQMLGRLIEAIHANQLTQTTNVIYTSDHGEMLGKFGLWWKSALYEDAVRIPCIAMGPDFKAQHVVKTPVDLLDVQASLFQSVGLKQPSEFIGIPLQQIEPDDQERPVFSEYHGHGTSGSSYMIRQGDWKLIYYMKGPNQLFDLSKDPNELTNVYETNKERASALENTLRQICNPEIENQRAEAFIMRQIALIEGK